MTDLYRMLPPDAIKIVLVLFLTFLLGFEREEHKVAGTEYAFGGVRTFPLVGLIGYAVSRNNVQNGAIVAMIAGLALVVLVSGTAGLLLGLLLLAGAVWSLGASR